MLGQSTLNRAIRNPLVKQRATFDNHLTLQRMAIGGAECSVGRWQVAHVDEAVANE